MAQIEVSNVTKEYIVNRKKKGLKGALVNLIHSDKTIFTAVDNISFKVETGDIVGYIGPNGAGKSTTIKMMTGILEPTKGSITINGLSPQKDRKTMTKEIGVVFGQRSQLYWDLRLGESYELLKRIYKVPDKLYQKNLSELTDILQIGDFIDIPVRQLSLGQRMRGELVGAMLHSPSILFLDEPTIGLDIDAKHAMREFILDINRKKQVTVILTTHDLSDVAELCKSLIVINHGVIVEDGPLHSIINRMSPYRVLALELSQSASEYIHPKASILKTDNTKIWYRFNQNGITASELISDLSKALPVKDLSVKEPDIEDAIREIYHTR